MNNKKIKEVLKKELQLITPPAEEIAKLQGQTKLIVNLLKENIKKRGLSADVFVGGSFAKNTLIKKYKYDVDIFVRFNTKYRDEELSLLLEKLMPQSIEKLHGSRDYFRIRNLRENMEFEIIPTFNIAKPETTENITDLSFFHVNYVTKKISKNKKLADEIRLAKAFAYYRDCYGAESYINGFSGYAIELLVLAYNGFVNFLKAVANSKPEKDKIILDPAKHYKNKQTIKIELNEAKLSSPIILIDPTYKERNALAALSMDTFIRFRKNCIDFLKNPSEKFFKNEDIENNFKKKYGKKVIELRVSTHKQAGDIAGTKLKKFSNFFFRECEKKFNLRAKAFLYDDKKNLGIILLAPEMKNRLEFPGPPIKMKEQLKLFKREHKKIVIKKGKAFAYEKPIRFDKFLSNFLNERSQTINEMDVSGIEVL